MRSAGCSCVPHRACGAIVPYTPRTLRIKMYIVWCSVRSWLVSGFSRDLETASIFVSHTNWITDEYLLLRVRYLA